MSDEDPLSWDTLGLQCLSGGKIMNLLDLIYAVYSTGPPKTLSDITWSLSLSILPHRLNSG